jgi:delta-aminolevulinic acid dehydratase/porphobilinogen synthase
MDWIHLVQDMNRDTVMKTTMLWFVIRFSSENYGPFRRNIVSIFRFENNPSKEVAEAGVSGFFLGFLFIP